MKKTQTIAAILLSLCLVLSGCQTTTGEQLVTETMTSSAPSELSTLQSQYDKLLEKNQSLQKKIAKLKKQVQSLKKDKKKLKAKLKAKNSSKSKSYSKKSTSRKSSSSSSSTTVYITRTGSKYHRAGCRYLSRSQISIRLSDAKAQGYEACSVCW